MKKIITMVGTSIFENYMEESDEQQFKNYFNNLKDKSAEQYDDEKNRISYIKKKINEWLKGKTHKINTSAEIKSLAKLKEEVKEDLEIYLLYSDTILSKVAVEILEEKLSEFEEFKNSSIVKPKLIRDLQVFNEETFLKFGLSNLIECMEKISEGYYENIIVNITGGYKVVVPYLTIFAQIYKIPIYYIFEDGNKLISIFPAPIDVKWGLFEKYSDILNQVSNGINNLSEFKNRVNYDEFYEDIKSLIWIVDNGLLLNPLGEILWKKYKSSLIFKIPSHSHYFNLTTPEKRRIQNVCVELYNRLKSTLSEIKTKKDAIKKIIELGENNDLRHATIIDKDEGVFIFKSTNETHIRLLYTFDIKEGKITSVTIYDFVIEKFNHEKYIDDFKRRYPDLKVLKLEIIPIEKKEV